MQVKFGAIKDLEEWKAFIKSIPRGTAKIAVSAVVDFIIGTPQRGLKRYQAYKYVSRKRAYGRTFKSKAQQGYVMARIHEGTMDPGVPHRTGRTQRGYRKVETRGGYGATIVNPEIGAYYTRDDKGQARLNELAGWQKAMDVIASNIAGAIRSAQAKVNEWLKSRR